MSVCVYSSRDVVVIFNSATVFWIWEPWIGGSGDSQWTYAVCIDCYVSVCAWSCNLNVSDFCMWCVCVCVCLCVCVCACLHKHLCVCVCVSVSVTWKAWKGDKWDLARAESRSMSIKCWGKVLIPRLFNNSLVRCLVLRATNELKRCPVDAVIACYGGG